MLVMTTAFHSLFFFVLFFLTFAHYIEYIQLFRLLLFFVNRIKNTLETYVIFFPIEQRHPSLLETNMLQHEAEYLFCLK